MKLLAAVAILICCQSGVAWSASFTQTARSGQATTVHTYMSTKSDCTPNTGVVKVLTKPEHGKLIPSHVNAVVTHPRGNTQCMGAKGPGFRVQYRSTVGFRGVDTFSIQVIWGRTTETDNYTVTVE